MEEEKAQRKFRGGQGGRKGTRAAGRPPWLEKPRSRISGDRHFRAEVDVLNSVEQLDTLIHGPLEGLASGDEAGAAGALVDNGGGHRFFEVVRSRGTSGIDQTGAAHETVR